jgi:hypothetical protein
MTTWKLCFQTGCAEQKAVIAEEGEEMIPSLQRHLEIFDIKTLSVPELFALNTKQMKYKAEMADFWRSTSQSSSFKLPLDALICPVHPSAGYPHDFTCVGIPQFVSHVSLSVKYSSLGVVYSLTGHPLVVGIYNLVQHSRLPIDHTAYKRFQNLE